MTTSYKDLERPEIVNSIGPAIEDSYAGVDWEPEELGLSVEYEALKLVGVDEISDAKVVGVRKMYGSKFTVKMEAQLACNFEVEIFKPYFPFVSDDDRMSVLFHDWNRHFVLAKIALSFNSEIALLVDTSDDENLNIVGVLSMTPEIPHAERLASTNRRRYRP